MWRILKLQNCEKVRRVVSWKKIDEQKENWCEMYKTVLSHFGFNFILHIYNMVRCYLRQIKAGQIFELLFTFFLQNKGRMWRCKKWIHLTAAVAIMDMIFGGLLIVLFASEGVATVVFTLRLNQPYIHDHTYQTEATGRIYKKIPAKRPACFCIHRSSKIKYLFLVM